MVTIRDLVDLAIGAPDERFDQVKLIREIVLALQINEVIQACPKSASSMRKVLESAGTAFLIALLSAFILHATLG